MSKALLISALFLAAGAHGALAQTPVQADDKSAAERKGPLGGLLEPWDGKGDEITPKKLNLGGAFQPWRETDETKPKQAASTAEPAPKKNRLLGGLLQPWGDRSDDTAVTKAQEPAAKKKSGLLQPWDDKHDDKATDVAKADEPVAKKKGPLGGLLQPWDSASDKP